MSTEELLQPPGGARQSKDHADPAGAAFRLQAVVSLRGGVAPHGAPQELFQFVTCCET